MTTSGFELGTCSRFFDECQGSHLADGDVQVELICGALQRQFDPVPPTHPLENENNRPDMGPDCE